MRTAIERRMRMPEPGPPPPYPTNDESMETGTSEEDPRLPVCSPTPVTLEEEEDIHLQDTLPLEKTQGDSEEEEGSEERNLEISLRMEANILEDRTKKAMHTAWREARRMGTDAA